MTYAESVLAVILIVLAGVGGWRLGRARFPGWLAGYFGPLAIITCIGLTRWIYPLTFHPAFYWLVRGRRNYLAGAMASALILMTLARRVPRRQTRWALGAFLAVVAGWYGVMPYLYPALVRETLASLPHRQDAQGVVRQQADYTCGPAAAATALRALGVEATEAEIAVEAHTSPLAGTSIDDLYEAIRTLYADQGVRVEYRTYDRIDELRGDAPVLVTIKHSFLIDHYVVVFGVGEGSVLVADPVRGLRRMPHESFASIWRHFGMVIRREGVTGTKQGEARQRSP